MILSLFSGPFLLHFAGCTIAINSDNLSEKAVPKSSTDQLEGEWEWSRTKNGWGGTETPALKGNTETLILGKNQSFKRIKNGVVTEEKYYYISQESSSELSQNTILFLNLVDKENHKKVSSQPIFLLGADSIKLRPAEICRDCPESYFVRRRLLPTN